MNAKKNLIQLHGPVPSHASAKSRLANDAYDWGHESFLIDGIPFSKYQSRYYANLIAKLIVEKVRLTSDSGSSPLYIYEFGAGSGLLALGILNQLKARYRHVYDRVHLQISDISDANLQDIRRTHMFRGHEDHIELRVADFLRADFFREESPFFIYCTYLIDALPSNRIVLHGGEAYEILTETYISESTQLIDVSHAIPKILKGTDIPDLLADSQTERRQPLRMQFGNVLLENYVHRPISESDLPKYLKQKIADFAARHPKAYRSPFSVPPAFFELLKQLAKQPNLTFFCTEVVTNDIEHLQKLPMGRGHVNYGLVSYHSLFCPFAKEVFEDFGLNYSITKRDNGTTAEFILENGKRSLQKPFQNCFSLGFDSPANGTIPLSELTDIDDLKKGLLNLHESVKGTKRLDFSYLNCMAGLLLKAKDLTLAKFYAKLLLNYAPSMAPVSYGVLAQVARDQNQVAQEKRWLTKGVAQFPQNRILASLLVNFFLRQNQPKKAIEHSKKLIKIGDRSEIIPAMLQVALLYLRIQNRKEARKWINGILDLEHDLQEPLDSDRDVFEKAKTLAAR